MTYLPSRIEEYSYHTLPENFSNISIDVYKALRLERRGLAVTLWLQEAKKHYVNPNDDTITPLTAGRVIDDIVREFKDVIKNCPVLVCGNCKTSYLPHKDQGACFLEITSISQTDNFVCNPCIKTEEERRANLHNIHPPPFNEWPEWVKEAFGPAKHLEADMTYS